MTKQHLVVVTTNHILQKTTMHDNYFNTAKRPRSQHKSTKHHTWNSNIIPFFAKSSLENSRPHSTAKNLPRHNDQNYILLRDICQLFNDDQIKSKITAAAKQIINEINNRI